MSTEDPADEVERDRELAWELYEAQPDHPQIAVLAQRVLARAPRYTGMIILLARHREACGDVAEARRLLRDLVGRRDHQFLNAVRQLRDLEYDDQNHAEALRLAEIVLREDPEHTWLDRMDHGSALVFVAGPEQGWREIDAAVELCARTDPERYAGALGQRALRLLASGGPPERFIPAAQEAIEADPTDRSIATALAFAYLYDYRPQDAEELLLRLLREDPTDEVAQGGLTVARGFLAPLERGDATMDDIRAARMGEVAWRILRDHLFGTGLVDALGALEEVLPDDLRAVLHPPLPPEEARETGGDWKLLSWRDGQQPGTGALWGDPRPFRLMTGAEVTAMDEAIDANPAAWPQWDAEGEYYTQLLTDDAGSYVIEGPGARLYLRSPEGPDVEYAESLADWVWDHVVAFGGRDPRPGRAGGAPASAPGPGQRTTDLLLLDRSAGDEALTRPVISFGGLPAVPPGTAFTWPRCGDLCTEPMRFLGKLVDVHAPADAPRLVLLFQCDNPDTVGGCETWDAESGANAAVLVPAAPELVPVTPPPGGTTVRNGSYAARVETFAFPERDLDPEYDDEHADYDDAYQAWREAHVGQRGRDVLGSLGGEPAWLQWPEPPTCPSCEQEMSFLANLEEGPSEELSANFGGGRAHVFTCTCDRPVARLLWQT